MQGMEGSGADRGTPVGDGLAIALFCWPEVPWLPPGGCCMYVQVAAVKSGDVGQRRLAGFARVPPKDPAVHPSASGSSVRPATDLYALSNTYLMLVLCSIASTSSLPSPCTLCAPNTPSPLRVQVKVPSCRAAVHDTPLVVCEPRICLPRPLHLLNAVCWWEHRARARLPGAGVVGLADNKLRPEIACTAVSRPMSAPVVASREQTGRPQRPSARALIGDWAPNSTQRLAPA